MPDLLVAINYWRFGDPPALGAKLRMDRYASDDRYLAPLARGGRLYVTYLTPKPEKIWLVAVLEDPSFDGARWVGAPTELEVTDISELRAQLRFATGAGWTNWCDSCEQTHSIGVQTLTPDDVALIDRTAGIVTTTERSAVTVASSSTGKHPGPLLDAILEHPNSDEARTVYADQLLANHDLRGQFILIDIALAGPLSIRKRQQLRARRAHLIAGYSSIWWPYKSIDYDLQKGFVRAIRGDWEHVAALHPEPFASEPVTEVRTALADDDDVTALLASPWLPRIHRLSLRGLSGDGFSKLACAPELAHLRGLGVSANELEASALATMTALPRLERLALSGNPIDDTGLEHLRAWPQLANIHALYVSNCEIGEHGLERFLAGAPLDHLATLTLSHNDLGDAGARILVERAEQLPALEHLELQNCSISSRLAKPLAAAFPKLRVLDVRRNGLDDELSKADARIRV